MAEQESDLRLEIAHVLFIDIVGSSKLLINQQSDVLRRLNEIVRETSQVRTAEAGGKLIRLPTGDGMALAFFTTPDAPVRCAMEISQKLKRHPDLKLRMGINSGPVDEVVDVNDRSNIAGVGITIAQRVMDCGDAGHILLSKRSAEDLAHYGTWRPHLRRLGECEIKHGERIEVFNFYNGEIGNPATPHKLIKESASVRRRRAVWIAAALLLVLGLAVAFALFHHHAPKPANENAIASTAEKKIAVLPFKPLVAENRDQVIELGMADTLIAKLSNSREIIVSSLNAVRKFSGLDQDAVSAGRELHVDSVLEGNVQRAGDRIRVSARLINVANGASLWAGTFDEKFTDVFTLQDAISQKVADALALRLSGEESKRLTKRYTENVEAYQLYLMGRYHWNKLTPPELMKSIEFFKRAIDLDPTYALAYFGLGDAYRALAPTSEVAPKEILPQAKAAATKALEIDESFAEPHATLAFIHTWYDWDWAGAEKEARRAIELNPNWGFAHIAYAQLLSALGRHQEAVAESTRATELDPLSLVTNALHAFSLFQARRFDEAIEQSKKTLELEPNFWIARLFLGKSYIEKGNYPEAIAELEKATELSGGNTEPISMTGCAWAAAGDLAKARAILKQLKDTSTQRYVPASNIAVLCYAVGEKDEAFTWLEKAFQDRDIRLCRGLEPKWDEMRSDPRFVAIRTRMGLR
jgi:TolB-like protein/Flp pilus assembly protein TadD/class 3 adenylate cyclase